MRYLVFQHIECEHPGSLRKFLERDGIAWDAVNLQLSDPIPDLEDYDALWVMGGPMDVWDVEEHPWLIPEKAAIRKWVQELQRPYLGLCLGHQLLADALGGTCGPQQPPEIGVLEVELNENGQKDPLLGDLAARQNCLQWHSVKVAQPPEGTSVLASSKDCAVQAMRVGEVAWSMQYHVELEPDTVDNWSQIPAYHNALMASVGTSGYTEMKRKASLLMPEFLQAAEIIHNKFRDIVRTRLEL